MEPSGWFVGRKCCEMLAAPRCFRLKASTWRPRGNPAVLSIRGTTVLLVCVDWGRGGRKKENVHFFKSVWSHTQYMALSNEINCIWNIEKIVMLSLISQDRKEITSNRVNLKHFAKIVVKRPNVDTLKGSHVDCADYMSSCIFSFCIYYWLAHLVRLCIAVYIVIMLPTAAGASEFPKPGINKNIYPFLLLLTWKSEDY